MRMSLQRNFWAVVLLFIGVVGANLYIVEGRPRPHRILLDTDVDTDDLFALLYLLKQKRSEFELEVSLCMINLFFFFFGILLEFMFFA
jgi:hypothetical protein